MAYNWFHLFSLTNPQSLDQNFLTSRNCLSSSCPLFPGTFRTMAWYFPLGEVLLSCLIKNHIHQLYYELSIATVKLNSA